MDGLAMGIALALGVFTAIMVCLGLGIVGYYAFHATVPPLSVTDVAVRVMVVGAIIAAVIGGITALVEWSA